MEGISGNYTSFSTASFTRPQSAALAQQRPEEPSGPSSTAAGGAAAAKGEASPQQANSSNSSGNSESSDRLTLSNEDRAIVEELKQRDAEVRAHEQAHLAAAGSYARGGARFEYQRGPDQRRYAVGGEVQMDTSAVPGSPDATIRKMQTVKRAALAPAEPSAQDYKVAASADLKANRARQELLRQLAENNQPAGSPAQQKGSRINLVI